MPSADEDAPLAISEQIEALSCEAAGDAAGAPSSHVALNVLASRPEASKPKTPRAKAADQPEPVSGKRERKSVEFYAPKPIHVTEKLAIVQVRRPTTSYCTFRGVVA